MVTVTKIDRYCYIVPTPSKYLLLFTLNFCKFKLNILIEHAKKIYV